MDFLCVWASVCKVDANFMVLVFLCYLLSVVVLIESLPTAGHTQSFCLIFECYPFEVYLFCNDVVMCVCAISAVVSF